jgi:hypothetical protein
MLWPAMLGGDAAHRKPVPSPLTTGPCRAAIAGASPKPVRPVYTAAFAVRMIPGRVPAVAAAAAAVPLENRMQRP